MKRQSSMPGIIAHRDILHLVELFFQRRTIGIGLLNLFSLLLISSSSTANPIIEGDKTKFYDDFKTPFEPNLPPLYNENSPTPSKNFTWKEVNRRGSILPFGIKTNCIRFASELELLRSKFGDKPLLINSWFRSSYWNKRVGGVPKSQHLTCNAADFTISGVSNGVVRNYVLSLPYGGVGITPHYIHFDLGPKRSWKY